MLFAAIQLVLFGAVVYNIIQMFIPRDDEELQDWY
mgnify:CR=1 FL=1